LPQDRQWPQSHTEQTDVLPTVPAHPAVGSGHDTNQPTERIRTGEAPTQHFGRVAGAQGEGLPGGNPVRGSWARLREYRKAGIVAAIAFGVLLLAYLTDLIVTSGDVPRGVTVAGVEVGGMSQSEAEESLRDRIEPRLTKPVAFTAGDVQSSFDPKQAGLRMDWDATLERAGDQPLNPFTRIASFFTTREVGVVTQSEPNQLDNAMAAMSQKVDRKPVEGNIVFEGAEPKPVHPEPGQQLDVAKAKRAILAHWASGQRLNLPVRSTPVHVTPEAVQTAMTQLAKPAVAAPVVVHGEGKDGTLEPEEIAKGLSFTRKGNQLVPKIDKKKIVAGVKPELASTEQEGKDATIVFAGGQPTVEPSQDGNQIDWDKTLTPFVDVLKKDDGRELTAHYEKRPAKLTTEQAKGLGINEVIGEFTTGGFASDSGVNIRRVAEEVDGAIVMPGKTFSLNGYTGTRQEPQGYIPAGIIKDGAPGTAVGGGISQFATTLYNASYFAGMKDAGHREHSYYISRYPEGREATVFQRPDGTSVIDLKFTNDSSTGVAIQTIWTPSSITVKLWGTKRYDVDSQTSERRDIVPPKTEKGPAKNCHPSSGGEGFTVTNTRILRDADTGEVVRREPRTVSYNPHSKIVCKGGH
jgi:vancomycin resistance protein YoaR